MAFYSVKCLHYCQIRFGLSFGGFLSCRTEMSCFMYQLPSLSPEPADSWTMTSRSPGACSGTCQPWSPTARSGPSLLWRRTPGGRACRCSGDMRRQTPQTRTEHGAARRFRLQTCFSVNPETDCAAFVPCSITWVGHVTNALPGDSPRPQPGPRPAHRRPFTVGESWPAAGQWSEDTWDRNQQ